MWHSTKTIDLNVYVARVTRTSIALQVTKIRLIIFLELILNTFFVASVILHKFHELLANTKELFQ